MTVSGNKSGIEESFDVVIVGGGVAGLATAYHLVQLSDDPPLVLEKEHVPGTHASGKNAGMIHNFHPERRMRDILKTSIQQLIRLQEQREEKFFVQRPSLWLFRESTIENLATTWNPGIRLRVHSSSKIPPRLHPADRKETWHWIEFPGDGLLDSGRYLQVLSEIIREEGGQIQTGENVIEGWREGEHWKVRTESGAIFRTKSVVNAAGAWVDSLAGSMDVPGGGFTPESRHLFRVKKELVPKRYGYYWDRVNGIYFRNTNGETLISICDSIPCEPGSKPDLDNPEETLARKVLQVYPQFGEINLIDYWYGRRTFSPDRKPEIYEDQKHPGFFWVGGFGGHGMTGSLEFGRRAAEQVMAQQQNQSIGVGI